MTRARVIPRMGRWDDFGDDHTGITPRFRGTSASWQDAALNGSEGDLGAHPLQWSPAWASRMVSRSFEDGPIADRIEAWKTAIVDDLGGPKAVSPETWALIDSAARGQLMLEYVDSWILSHESLIDVLVNKRERRVYPIALDRMRISEALARQLFTLERIRKRNPPSGPSLAEILREAALEKKDTSENI